MLYVGGFVGSDYLCLLEFPYLVLYVIRFVPEAKQWFFVYCIIGLQYLAEEGTWIVPDIKICGMQLLWY
jgi:hypothetical protein